MKRWRGIRLLMMRQTSMRQSLLPFFQRARFRKRAFKVAILMITALTVSAILASSSTGRFGVILAWNRIRWGVQSIVGLKPSREEIEAELRERRWLGVEQTRAALRHTAVEGGPRIDRLLKATRMDADHAVIRWGNFDGTLVLSSDVFEPDDTGRSYRFIPSTSSIWFIGLTLSGVMSQFQVRDTPEAREACAAAGAYLVPESVQTTNSWGCRGNEPDTQAPLRGIVLGDSVIQGLLVGDHDTPPACLEREMAARTGLRTSVLNTGVLGYSPEQYYYTLERFADRMRPHFVIVGLCGNDFGLTYLPESIEESCYWLDRIVQFCRSRQIPYLMVPWPGEDALLGWRDESTYPGFITKKLRSGGNLYLYPVEAFTDEELRLRLQLEQEGKPTHHSPLYNRHLMGDNHLSALGCAFWGRVVAERLYKILARQELARANRASAASSPDK